MQANAVARIDNLDFLADVIPKTTTYKQFKEKREREEASAAAAASGAATAAVVPPGQTTLFNGFGNSLGAGRRSEREDSPRMESDEVLTAEKLSMPVNGSPIAVRTIHSSSHGHPPKEPEDDVEMEDEAMT